MPVFNNILAGAAGQTGGAAAAGPIKSLRFNSGDSAYLSRTPSSAGNRKKWTWSGWVKRSGLDQFNYLFDAVTTNPATGENRISFQDNEIKWYSNATTDTVETVGLFRDTSAWYHVVFAYDSAQSTSSDRIKIYVNGVLQTLTGTYPSQNAEPHINNTRVHRIGGSAAYGRYFDGYLADIYFIDGSALDATSFGAFDDNGVWQAAAYSGTFGTNGFHLLDFANESTIGHDSSGNENDFTAYNFSTSAGAGNDVLFDVPTNGDQSDTGAGGEVSGNYATYNALLDNSVNGNGAILSDGNLKTTFTSSSSTGNVPATIYVSSGKWYCEFTCVDISSSAEPQIGVVKLGDEIGRYIGRSGNNGVGWEPFRDRKYYGSGFTDNIFGGTTYTSGTHTFGVALDMDDGTVDIYKDGTLLGELASGLSGDYTFAAADIGGTDTPVIIANFGQRPFASAAPSGFKCLCTTNLPTPTIADGSDYFDNTLYTGNGSSQSITGLGFSPDLVWLKSRGSAFNNFLIDTVRGNTKLLKANSTAAETTTTTAITSFDSNGFSLGSGSQTNANNDSMVAWTWDAGSSTVSNTDGSITSSVRANPTAGFSIVGYTGSGSTGTVGHGLNVAPSWYIVKARTTTAANSWRVYHVSLGNTKQLFLESTSSASTNSNAWNNSGPTSTTFSVGSLANESSGNYIAYCFAPVEGYSAFGSYEGNGSTDGPFVHTGFRPAWLMFKRTDTANSWMIYDAARNTFNVIDNLLKADSSNAETSVSGSDLLDFLSNGFKIREDNPGMNASGGTYAYMCFAENPFQANGGLAR